jgi:hypothetical protein
MLIQEIRSKIGVLGMGGERDSERSYVLFGMPVKLWYPFAQRAYTDE